MTQLGITTICVCLSLVPSIANAAGWDDSGVMPLERYQASEFHMGTKFTIALYANDEVSANRAIRSAFQRIAELDARLSDFQAESEVSRLGAASPTDRPVPVSDDLWHVLVAAQQLSGETHGAFDVTVGPLTRLWRRARRQKQFPAEPRLAAARQAVGYQGLKLDMESHSVSLTRPNMRLDLGAIAKGFAVDEALEQLARCGITRALVNGGGDLCAAGPPPDAEGWPVGIVRLERDAPPSRFIALSHQAIATSGDAFQFVEIDGVRYSHILDPRNGRPLTRRFGVTVLADRCMTADSVASAISVIGPTAGLSFVNQKPGLEALIVTAENDRVRISVSEGFPAGVTEIR